MKRTQLLVLSVLALGVQGAAHATYPADAEANYHLAPAQTYADRYAGAANSSAAWGVSRREVTPHNPFPFGGGYIDD